MEMHTDYELGCGTCEQIFSTFQLQQGRHQREFCCLVFQYFCNGGDEFQDIRVTYT